VKVILFGATGMVGQGVLRECLLDDGIEEVLAVGRASTGQQHPKLREIVQPDLADLSPVADDLTGFDACLFCLGVSSTGMSEDEYRRITYDLTLSAARTLIARNPELTFAYVSGAGTDHTGRSRMMWARVKGQTENALLDLPIRAYMFRPAFIQPLHGAKSKTRIYSALYTVSRPLLPLLRRLWPSVVTDTERLGRAMIAAARVGAPKPVLETRDINALAGADEADPSEEPGQGAA
jgi:uncharacterized protein YbjT (DUF2867 family)